jgi:hypothetical protein
MVNFGPNASFGFGEYDDLPWSDHRRLSFGDFRRQTSISDKSHRPSFEKPSEFALGLSGAEQNIYSIAKLALPEKTNANSFDLIASELNYLRREVQSILRKNEKMVSPDFIMAQELNNIKTEIYRVRKSLSKFVKLEPNAELLIRIFDQVDISCDVQKLDLKRTLETLEVVCMELKKMAEENFITGIY